MQFGKLRLGALGAQVGRVNSIVPGVIAAGAGSYSWSGDTMAPIVDHVVAAGAGSYAWTGQSASLLADRVLAAAAGAYTWTGQDATLTKASGAYSAQGVNFDGTNDYLTRGAALTGAASGKKGTVSFWFKMNGGNSATQSIFEPNSVTGAGHLYIRRNSSNKIVIQGRGGFSTVLQLTSNTSYTSAMSAWAHCVASWDLASGVGKIYVDGADDTAASPTLTNANIEYASPTNLAVGGTPAGGQLLNADLAELYVNFSDYLDLTNSANVQKFRSAGGAPVNLGSDGSTPTGNQPIAYFKNATATWESNLGSGGGFTENGALTDAATNPP